MRPAGPRAGPRALPEPLGRKGQRGTSTHLHTSPSWWHPDVTTPLLEKKLTGTGVKWRILDPPWMLQLEKKGRLQFRSKLLFWRKIYFLKINTQKNILSFSLN